jgi:glycerate kinase
MSAEYMAIGAQRGFPDAIITRLPLLDRAEGLTRAIARMTGGWMYSTTVTGPMGIPVNASITFSGGTQKRTAVIDAAEVIGLQCVPLSRRDPWYTSSLGVGELIREALDLGAQHVVVATDESVTCDAGAGMAKALGVRLLNAHGQQIRRGAAGLLELTDIDMSRIDPRLRQTRIEVACAPTVLVGARGAAQMLKEVTPLSSESLRQVALALEHFTLVAKRQLNYDVRFLPGGGAGGGLAAGLFALAGAWLRPYAEVVLRAMQVDERLQTADALMTTAPVEGEKSSYALVSAELARRARFYGASVVILDGGKREPSHPMIDEFPDALGMFENDVMDAAEYLANATERLLQRTFQQRA